MGNSIPRDSVRDVRNLLQFDRTHDQSPTDISVPFAQFCGGGVALARIGEPALYGWAIKKKKANHPEVSDTFVYANHAVRFILINALDQ